MSKCISFYLKKSRIDFKISIDFYINHVHNYYINVQFKHIKDTVIFQRFHLFIFRERGGEGKREGEKH